MSRYSTQGSWPTGWVARHLGISPITLRTWDVRYGIGPTHREPGRHRRYTSQDIERLKTMQRLIEEGTRPREAASLAIGRATTVPDADSSALADSLGQAAELLRMDTMAALLDAFFASRGVCRTWHDVLRPVVRAVGARSVLDADCRDVEWALAESIAAALDRVIHAHQHDVHPGRPALLICCPHERHTLPLRVLAAALHERSVPTAYLGDTVPADTALAAARRLRPATAVLWALRRENTAPGLARHLHAREVPLVLAGSGWQDFTAVPAHSTDDLQHALDLVETLTQEPDHQPPVAETSG